MKNEGSNILSRSGWPEQWRRRIVVPTLGDLLLALVYGLFVRISIGAVVRGDIGAVILAIQELSIIVLVLIRRRTCVVAAGDSPPAVLAWCGTILPLLLRPATLAPFPFAMLGNVIQLVGGLLVLAATLRLGRSFGIVAANRGIQTGGLYRGVRHPIYAAYVLAFGGFVFSHPALSNVVILGVWLGVQILRIQAEERLLRRDAHYVIYAALVRYRLIPGWW